MKNSLAFQQISPEIVTTSNTLKNFLCAIYLKGNCRKVINAGREISERNRKGGDDASLCALTGDNPLYLSMIFVLYKYFGGRREQNFSNVSPHLGLMHCYMELFDAVKHLSFEAVLDAIVQDRCSIRYQAKIQKSQRFQEQSQKRGYVMKIRLL